ncbi:MAG: hypothetical protein NZ108_10535 [Bacteroidia bacterium]|nr:hypothetical protein [Bacteroidia bacterium]
MKNLFLIGLIVFFFWSCNKKENPFYNPNSQSIETVQPPANADPTTITGLHQRIFSTKCANPGCHDGSFEPDFRTVQSTYSSTAFHPVAKNDTILNFQFRVVPFDTARSWLWYRVTTHDTVLGRMPLYAPPLNAEELRNLSTWIMNGARDVNGKVPDPPNFPPVFEWYIARDANNTSL